MQEENLPGSVLAPARRAELIAENRLVLGMEATTRLELTDKIRLDHHLESDIHDFSICYDLFMYSGTHILRQTNFSDAVSESASLSVRTAARDAVDVTQSRLVGVLLKHNVSSSNLYEKVMAE